MTRPNTVVEWQEYIRTLAGKTLYSQVLAANTHAFARRLVDEGATMAEVEQIMLAFARQLRATGVQIPGGGPFDLVTMALVDAAETKASRPAYTPEEVALLETQEWPPIQDDFDLFEAGAAG